MSHFKQSKSRSWTSTLAASLILIRFTRLCSTFPKHGCKWNSSLFIFLISHRMKGGAGHREWGLLSGRRPDALEPLRMEDSEQKRAVDPEWLQNEPDKTLIKRLKSALQSQLD